MARKWSDVRKERTPEAEARIAAHRTEMEREMSLAELRHALELTQTRLAETLGMTQGAVSRLEHQSDLLLSTLRSYVEALGGELEIRARFGEGEEVTIGSLGELEREPPVEERELEHA
jgi:transcriptional regulator with XRE-family HTH domain